MDESHRHLNPNPMLSANIISKGFFCWLNPLLTKGHSQPLDTNDMFNVLPDDTSEKLGSNLEKEWMKEVEKIKSSGGTRKPSLLRALVRIFGLRYMLLGIIVFIEEAVRVVQPLLLGGLIRFFTPNSSVTLLEAYMYALGVSLCAILIAATHHPYFFGVTRMGMQMRVACCSLMYKKALRLSNSAMGQTTTGQIVNLMSNDVNRFDQAVIFLHFLWIGPLQAIAVLVILWQELGPSVLAGFAVLFLLIPVQGAMGKLFSKLRRKTAVHTDERVKVMNEIIAGIRVIKMYCWEKPFGDLVEKLRGSELACIWTKLKIVSFPASVWFFAHHFLICAIVITQILLGMTLKAKGLFMTTSFMFILARNDIGLVFDAVGATVDAIVSASRLQNFLLLEEINKTPDSSDMKSELRPKPEDCCVEIKNLTAKWNENLDSNTLENVSATLNAGKLLAVIGPVGAGKSSLLMAILGELPAVSGSVNVKGKVAYVSQQPWVFSGSLRQNILFGSMYDKSRFDKVVKASALYKDLEIMPYGDSTLIGDRGVSLSGGQRARVSLARALYMDADIYLLDDPLSAVDTAVGRHIFDNYILGVLRKKPRILVTHQLQYLEAADSILILSEGKAVGMGTFEELSNSGIDFAALLKASEDEGKEPPLSPISDGNPPLFVEYGSHLSLVSSHTDFEPEAVQLPEEEQRQAGNVGLKVYREYFKAGAGCFTFFMLVIFNVIAQCTYIMSDWWLSRWSNEEELRVAAIEKHEQLLDQGFNETNITIPFVDRYQNIAVFSGIIGGVFVFGMVRALLFFKVTVDASQTLHNRMFARILRAPIRFFDTNPVGRILNRFSKDVGHMDDLLPVTFFDFVQCFLLIIGIVLVSGIVNPWVFIPVIPLICMFLYIRWYYLSTSRSVKRLEGVCRSPVFSYLSASLQGLHTIRAFNMEKTCTEEFDAYQDLHSEAWFLFISTSRWLAVRLDWLCAIFVTSVTFCSVLAAASLDAGLVGLSVTYAMTLMGMFQWGVRQSAEVENQMISVERVLEYSQLPTEAALELEGGEKKPPDDWPDKGTIVANNVCLKYSPNAPYVLKNLTFRVKEKEKVGIVGRTGAGKSSLITSLFRLVEPTGQLLIDEVDILSLGLHDLRKTISIIPQDPVLFTGTLRKNLDPFYQHNDDQLWRALAEVQLKPLIDDLPSRLETQVSEGGVNFSVGQRQLICLARAILRRNRILLIDEATANVDPKTDELIQKTIREKFCDCTVLTIAHRLHTIMDSDRVLVLADGCIVEFEEPYLLLKRGSGVFYSMVQQTSKADGELLMKIAAEAYADRHGLSLPEAVNDNIENSLALIDDDLDGVGQTSKKRMTKMPNILDQMNLQPPLALAESFHSVFRGHDENEDEDEDDIVDERQALKKHSDDARYSGNFLTVPQLSKFHQKNTTSASPTNNGDLVAKDSHLVSAMDMGEKVQDDPQHPLFLNSIGDDDVFIKSTSEGSVQSPLETGIRTSMTDSHKELECFEHATNKDIVQGISRTKGEMMQDIKTSAEINGQNTYPEALPEDLNINKRDNNHSVICTSISDPLCEESGIETDVNGSAPYTEDESSNQLISPDNPLEMDHLFGDLQDKISGAGDATPDYSPKEFQNSRNVRPREEKMESYLADKLALDEDENYGESELDVLILPLSHSTEDAAQS